jgi:hypothetical protein
MTSLAKAATTVREKVWVNCGCSAGKLTIVVDNDILLRRLPEFSFPLTLPVPLPLKRTGTARIEKSLPGHNVLQMVGDTGFEPVTPCV